MKSPSNVIMECLLAKSKYALKGMILQLQLQVGKVRIPRILLGTSPFIGAGQFGAKAPFYRAHFYENPKNIAKLVHKAVELGITGIQLLPYPPIFRALEVVERDLGERLTVVGTVGPDEPQKDIEDLRRFNTVAMVLHGELTDRRDLGKTSDLLDEVHSAGCLAGIATHEPKPTLKWLMETKPHIDLLMLPFNRLGMFMDASPQEVAKAIERIHKPVIGKKVLAAGYLKPKEAMEYVARVGCIDAVALGVTSEREADETFGTAAKAFFSSAGNRWQRF